MITEFEPNVHLPSSKLTQNHRLHNCIVFLLNPLFSFLSRRPSHPKVEWHLWSKLSGRDYIDSSENKINYLLQSKIQKCSFLCTFKSYIELMVLPMCTNSLWWTTKENLQLKYLNFTQRNLLVDIAPTRNSDWMYRNTDKSNGTC